MTGRIQIVLAICFFLLGCPTIFARERNSRNTKIKKPAVTNRPAELRGSKEQRIAQNIKAINLGVGQIAADQEILTRASNNLLVELTDTNYYIIDKGVAPVRKLRRGKKTIVCPPKKNRVFIRAHAAPYINLLAHDFFQEFRKKLKITSGTRSLKEQILMRTKGSCYYNPNAAIANDSLEESLHVRGIAVDISRRVITVVKGKLKEAPMSRKETKWMRDRLIADKLKGVEFETEPIEENSSYHIVVFPK